MGAVGWLHGPEFETVEATCSWASRPPGSCGLRVTQLAGARACSEKTDYRRSAAMLRQTIPYTPDTGNEN